MQRSTVDSMEQFFYLIREAKRREEKLESNCILTPATAKALIEEKKLRYAVCDAGLILFCDRGGYETLYYYLTPENPIDIQAGEVPYMVEWIYRGQQRTESFYRIQENWKRAGFVPLDQAVQMRCQREEHTGQNPPQPGGGLRIVRAEERHAEEIERIWEEAFDPIVNQLPTREELRQAIGRGEIILACDSAGKVAGVLQEEFRKGAGMIRHEAVRPEYRRQGIGRMLSERYFYDAQERGIFRHTLWVSKGNQAAKAFHGQFGFVEDGNQIEEYILRG